MIKVKICGVRNSKDARYAAQLGAWAIGFIFVKMSPRYIEIEEAHRIIELLPVNVEKIGVFADASIDEIKNTVKNTAITKVQLHGNESPELCEELKKTLNIPLIKAIRISKNKDIEIIGDYSSCVESILLDSYSKNQLGGTGESFNWEIAKQAKKFNVPIILAGGITSSNIEEAYLSVEPYAIDLSSGIEKSKGIKDHSLLEKLFSIVSTL